MVLAFPEHVVERPEATDMVYNLREALVAPAFLNYLDLKA